MAEDRYGRRQRWPQTKIARDRDGQKQIWPERKVYKNKMVLDIDGKKQTKRLMIGNREEPSQQCPDTKMTIDR